MLRLFRIHIHKDDIRPDLADILIADAVIVSGLKEAAENIFIADNDLADAAVTLVKLQVGHVSQLFAVFDVDDLFVREIA